MGGTEATPGGPDPGDGAGVLTASQVLSFEDFIRPLAFAGELPSPSTPLGRLPAGDYAVLGWLDGLQVRFPAEVEAEITARWNTAPLRDIYATIVAAADPSGVPS